MIHKNQLHPWLFFIFVLVSACSGHPPEKASTLPSPVAEPSVPVAVPDYVLPVEARQQMAEILRTDLEASAPAGNTAVAGMTLAQGVAAFYRNRDFQPAWNDAKALAQLIAALEETRFDGLEPSEYSLQELKQKYPMLANMNSFTDRVQLDLTATRACLSALVHLRMGKLDPYRLESQWNFSSPVMDAQLGLALLEEALANQQLDSLFQLARPQQPMYRGLREGLRQLYAIEAQGGWQAIPPGETLKRGMTDAERIPLLRARLITAGVLTPELAEGDYFDAPLHDAVVKFQREQTLDADGAVGRQTLATLNVPIHRRIAQVRANLERGRWLLHEVNGDFVWVDIAGYLIHLYRDGEPVWSARVQVGTPYRSTPIFRSRINYVTFNPTWTIPPTIFKEDILPKVRSNPEYLAEKRLSVLDSRGSVLDPATINWQNPGNIMLRESAGPLNPLGKVVIRFPNSHAIYMHDTPSKGNFSRSQRAFSSGCIRVERPLELVELLFDDPKRWDREAIETAIETGETRDVGFKVQVPVLITYSTVGVASDGRLVFKEDIYDRDPALISALDQQLIRR